VWICPFPNGHLQATGIDAAGRKQYRYHDAWRTRRDAEKFEDMTRFARALPKLREQVEKDLAATDELTRERVLACAIRLLDRGFFRVGTEEYTESFGLATIRKRHVRIEDGQMVFDYVAKSGKRRIQGVVDPLAQDIVCSLKKRRGGGSELLAYKNGRQWFDLRSDDINDYLKAKTGDDFSAKDFRTWSATVIAALALAVSGPAHGTKTSRQRAITRAIKETSHYLGNTPAVCRASYIDPRVFDAYRGGLIIRPAMEEAADTGVERIAA
jgi:DNA topoisomerase IB